MPAPSELLASHPDVTAVFAANDTMALGARAALREAGRRVPEDASLVGYDDSLLARARFLDLTTVDSRNARRRPGYGQGAPSSPRGAGVRDGLSRHPAATGGALVKPRRSAQLA